MKRYSLMAFVAALLTLSSAATTPVRAGGGDVAVGPLGGFAAGTIIGAALPAATAGVCRTGAGLLLDARTARVGRL